MIAVFTAIMPEAAALLDRLKEKGTVMKREEAGNIPLFMSEDKSLLLAVTGSGELASAITTARILTQYRADFAVNFGTAAGNEPVSSCFTIDKIMEDATGRDFYPAMLWKTHFPERVLRTVVRPVSSVFPGELADMEGAAFFQAADRFLTTDRIIVLKVVSDSGVTGKMSAAVLKETCACASGAVVDYLFCLRQAADALSQENKQWQMPDPFTQALEDLHGSETMRQRMARILRWLHLSGQNPEELVRRLYESGELPAQDKKHGKEVLEKIEREVL